MKQALSLLIALMAVAALPLAAAEPPGKPLIELPDLGKPEKPEKPERPEPPGQIRKDVVKDLVQDFKEQAEDYKKKQQALVKQFKDATGEERAKIREQLKELQQQFKEAKETFTEQVRNNEKLRELKRKVDQEVPPVDGAPREQ